MEGGGDVVSELDFVRWKEVYIWLELAGLFAGVWVGVHRF